MAANTRSRSRSGSRSRKKSKALSPEDTGSPEGLKKRHRRHSDSSVSDRRKPQKISSTRDKDTGPGLSKKSDTGVRLKPQKSSSTRDKDTGPGQLVKEEKNVVREHRFKRHKQEADPSEEHKVKREVSREAVPLSAKKRRESASVLSKREEKDKLSPQALEPLRRTRPYVIKTIVKKTKKDVSSNKKSHVNVSKKSVVLKTPPPPPQPP
jgi:hypothetical protein